MDYFTPLKQECADLATRLPAVLAYLELTRFAVACHAPGRATACTGRAVPPTARPPQPGQDKENLMAHPTPVDNWLAHAAACEQRGELGRAYRALTIALRFDRDGECVTIIAGLPSDAGDVMAAKRRPDRSVYA